MHIGKMLCSVVALSAGRGGKHWIIKGSEDPGPRMREVPS